MNCQRGSKVLPKNGTWLHTEEESTNRLQGLLLSVEELESVEARPYITLCTTVDLHQWPKSSIPTCKGMDRQKQCKQPEKNISTSDEQYTHLALMYIPQFQNTCTKSVPVCSARAVRARAFVLYPSVLQMYLSLIGCSNNQEFLEFHKV
jgi:hypothetical protein